MKRLIFGLVLLFLLCGCREEGIIIETMTPSPPTSATEGVVTTSAQASAATQTVTTEPTQETTIPVGSGNYVLNISSKKFHLPTCGSVANIKAENRKDSNAARDELMAEGYVPCGKCNP